MPKKIEIFFDLDYGIFTMKTTGLNLSKTKINKLQNKIKREIKSFLDDSNIKDKIIDKLMFGTPIRAKDLKKLGDLK